MAKNTTPKLSDYKYVDVWYSDTQGKSSSWKRLQLDEVAKFQQEDAVNFNCFATVQRFAEKEKTEGAAFIAPLYFDLDYGADPSVSQREAAKLVSFFTQELDVELTDLRIYFSGSKGFHILIEPEALGIEPRADLHKAYKHVAGYLRYRLGTKEEPLKSIDLVVYTSSRMLRLPNSVHAKTRLFKVELTASELESLTLDEIKALAKEPRRDDVLLTDEERAKKIKLRDKAAHFYKDKLQEYLQAAATAKTRYDNEEYAFSKGKPPVCVQDILEGGWKKDGDRNQATVQLACYFKDAGHSKQEALEMLENWVTKHTSADSSYQVQQRIANTRSVVDSVYSKDSTYKFGCAFIRSLHGYKKQGEKDYDRVKCAGELCTCLKKNTPGEDEIEQLHLALTGKAEYNGKLVQTNVMIAGKKHTPYIVPKKIEYACWGQDGCKKDFCPLYNIPTGISYKDLGVYDREVIQMAGIGDDNIKGILKAISGIPNCAKYNVEILEYTNVDDLLAIPMADNNKAAIDYEDAAEGRYVLRKVYAVGDIDISENRYYELTGYVFPHPKDQSGTIIIKDAKPLQDVVESYKLTDEIRADLQVLQPADYSAVSINEKIQAICNDLTYNVTHIVERDETLLAVLLTYHSVLRFSVPWDMLPIRGWLETMIVGDTGTGKSALIEKTMQYAGLGARVNAESTSRTGLTYKMEQAGSGGAWYIVWGAWPLADKEIIWIDEATGIDKEEYGQMTLARSDGKLEVKRAVTAETPCRVRAILSGNVPNGKRLADYGQGVEALKDILNNEDIRRFDFSVFMRSTDVNPELYNQQLPTYPKVIGGDTLKNNILFAWSRQPDQVLFDAAALDRILEVSTELSKIYGAATDVPLVSSSDQRNKVARLSVALAALTHSVDESGGRLMVWPGHVDYIAEYLKALYNAPGCGLNYYAKLSVREEELTDDRYDKINWYLKQIDTLKGEKKYLEFITLFAQQKYLRLGDVEAMLSIDKDEAKTIVNLLVKLRMVIMTSGGYRKTPRFNSFIAKAFEKGVFDNIDNDLI